MLLAFLGGLRRAERRSAKSEENQNETSPLGQALDLAQALHCGDSSRYPVQIEAFAASSRRFQKLLGISQVR